jgi:hypothetical protein
MDEGLLDINSNAEETLAKVMRMDELCGMLT